MQKVLDATAVGLSGLCMIHCLALPLAAAALPLAGELAHAEWVHWAVLAAAAPVAIFALGPAYRRSRFIPLLGLSGVALLLLGALDLPGMPPEALITTLGGLTLASAHILNWKTSHRHGENCPIADEQGR